MPRIHEHAPACNSFLQHREPPPQRTEFLPAAPSSAPAFCLRAGADTSDIVTTVTTSETADIAAVTARHELNKPAEAAAATVEALMFSLRSGMNELTKAHSGASRSSTSGSWRLLVFAFKRSSLRLPPRGPLRT